MTEHTPPDLVLSTGRVVKHRTLSSGATEAYFADGSAMTESEWREYCAVLLNRIPRKIRRRAA